MVVPIGNITLSFANSNVTYVAIGMNVNASAYAANSRLMNVSSNTVNVEFSLGVKGDLKIKTNTTGNSLFTLFNNNKMILTQNNNKLLTNVNTVIDETLYTKSYAEGGKFVSTSNGAVFLDLNEATKFFIKSNAAGKVLNSLSITKPASFVANRNRSLSCMMTVIDGADVKDNFWNSAGVVWPNGKSPSSPKDTNPKLYSLMYSPNFPYNWFGFTNYERVADRYLLVTPIGTGSAALNIFNFLLEKGVPSSKIDFATYSSISSVNYLDYKMIFDTEYADYITTTASDFYYNYMVNGAAKLYLQSEHGLYYDLRNQSVLNFIKRCGESSSTQSLSDQYFRNVYPSVGYALTNYYFNWFRGRVYDGTSIFHNAVNGLHPSFRGGAKAIAYTTTEWEDYDGTPYIINWQAARNSALFQGAGSAIFSNIYTAAYWDNDSLNVSPNAMIATVYDVNYLDVHYFSGGGYKFNSTAYAGKQLLNAIYKLFAGTDEPPYPGWP